MTAPTLIEELVKALEPFAVAADAIDKEFPSVGDNEIYETVGPNIREYGEWRNGPDCRFLTHGNFRHAREALSHAHVVQSDDWRHSQAALDVLAERRRQIEIEGWTPDHDDTRHASGGLVQAAICYAAATLPAAGYPIMPANEYRMMISRLWPWDWSYWKPKDIRRDLVRSAALVIAEIERLDRATQSENPAPQAGVVQSDEWQPIETAPKDGSVFDVWLGDANEAEAEFYCTPSTRRSCNWLWREGKFRPYGSLHTIPTFVVPTHWRPLPSPPSRPKDNSI